MAYIGKEPAVGNFQVCDAISVVNGQAAYTMQVSSTNVVPESANHMLVSLNGILQKPNSSFTVSGSTITFASNLATGDVIDFIMLLGNVLDIGTPSDSTVTNAKTNFVTTSSAAGLQIKGDGSTAGALQLNCEQNSHGILLQSPPHSANQSYTLKFPSGNVTAGKFLKVDSVSGSGTTGVGTMTFADGGGGAFEKISTSTISSSVASISFDTLSTDYRDFRLICSDLRIDTHQQFPVLKVKRAGQSSYDGGSSEYIYAMMGYDSDGNEIKAQSTGDNKLKLLPASLARDATVDGANADIIIDCYNVHATDSKFMIGVRNTFIEGTYGRAAGGFGGGYRNALDAIIGIQVAFEGSTNAISGTITLYGRKI